VNNCGETLNSVPNTVVAPVRTRNGGSYVTSFLESTWEWCGVTVPLIRDFWHAHVLATSTVLLLWKYGRGGLVGLRVFFGGENLM
jgi:hypothetical protein